MTNVKMKAVDQVHISSVKADSLQPGEQFEVTEATAKDLEDRGLAKRVGGAKAEPAPTNKAEPAPTNKAAPAPISRATVKAPAGKAKS
jgi:hypothetical protein